MFQAKWGQPSRALTLPKIFGLMLSESSEGENKQPEQSWQQPQQEAGNTQQPVYTQPQTDYGAPPPNKPACPSDYLVGNIILTVLGLCTCIGLVLGIVGIVFSSQVKSKYALGDYAGAQNASNTAKVLFIVNLVLTILAVLGWVVYFVFVVSLVGNISSPYFYDMYDIFGMIARF